MFKKILTLTLMTILLTACMSAELAENFQRGKLTFQSGNFKKAFHQLLPVAVAGQVEAQYAVGYMYYYGYGVSQDTESGLFWMHRAAEQHFPPALQALAKINQ